LTSSYNLEYHPETAFHNKEMDYLCPRQTLILICSLAVSETAQ